MLLNLAGSAPWFARAQIATLHDAAVFDQPQAYTRAFRWWYRSLFRHLARGSGRLLTVSEFSRQRLASALGVPAGRLEVVPNGGDHFERLVADRRVLSELGLAGQPYLLAVASANPTKNLARLVSAFGQLSSSAIDLRLVLVGGINRRVFASAGGALSTPGLVQAGAVDDARLKALYEQALGLVLPSVYEGFGLPALEAMSCGCPVIAAQAAALPEICGEAALYVDPLSSDQLAEAMARLAADSGIRNDLRVAGRRRVAQFGWQEAGRQLLELVEAAASTTSD
ncbi:MAG TPA: glycosyltransferase family 1 protein [Ideonella sp.]|uniref:glycosyltransferase family 4 protein n=1 Tax=Ideonella sp. TaxID=1929293 RepID=UPI002E2EC6E5|nr:glycosyltransferase family 1 protein [Ideonella sp.]HEX5686718.1 glycosyltransferase family 1 protein [Ideonella sp.]